MSVPFLNLKAQYNSIKDEIDPAIADVIQSSAFALGPAVKEFEDAFAEYCGVKHCLGVGSGTAALFLLMKAHGIGPGDEVITAPNSFFASAEAISIIGAIPVFVDVREETANMDPALLEEAITERTKAILPVHLYGQPAQIDDIQAIADKHNLPVFEDAAQAHGAMYKGKKAGSLANGATFSFYPGKNLGAYGEAGAVLTNNSEIAEMVDQLRKHGEPKRYTHNVIGYNERMDGIQGAVLNVKLKQLDSWNSKRREHAAAYRSELEGVGDIRMFEELEECQSSCHLFVIKTSKRDELQTFLKEKDIQTGIHYPIPIHLQKAYADRGFKPGDFPVTEKMTSEILSLPLSDQLTEEERIEVCEAVKQFFS